MLTEAKPANRKPTNVTLPDNLVEEARALGVNVSQACERGLVAELRRVRAEEWRRENQAGIDEWNAYVEEHGIPLAEYRQF